MATLKQSLETIKQPPALLPSTKPEVGQTSRARTEFFKFIDRQAAGRAGRLEDEAVVKGAGKRREEVHVLVPEGFDEYSITVEPDGVVKICYFAEEVNARDFNVESKCEEEEEEEKGIVNGKNKEAVDLCRSLEENQFLRSSFINEDLVFRVYGNQL